MTLILRSDLNRKLSIEELDNNFTYLEDISSGGTFSQGATGPAGATGPVGATGPSGGGTSSLPDEFEHQNSVTGFRLINRSAISELGQTSSIAGVIYTSDDDLYAVGVFNDTSLGTYPAISHVDVSSGIVHQVSVVDRVRISSGVLDGGVSTFLDSVTHSLTMGYLNLDETYSNVIAMDDEKIGLIINETNSKFLIENSDGRDLLEITGDGDLTNTHPSSGFSVFNKEFLVGGMGTYSGGAFYTQTGSFSAFGGVVEYRGSTAFGGAVINDESRNIFFMTKGGSQLASSTFDYTTYSDMIFTTQSLSMNHRSNLANNLFQIDSNIFFTLTDPGLSPSTPASFLIGNDGGDNLLRLGSQGTYSQTNNISGLEFINDEIYISQDFGGTTYSFVGGKGVGATYSYINGVLESGDKYIPAMMAAGPSGQHSLVSLVPEGIQLAVREDSTMVLNTQSIQMINGDGGITFSSVRLQDGGIEFTVAGGDFEISATASLFSVSENSMSADVMVSPSMGGTTGYANDVDAALGGVPIGGMYHNAGDIKIRVV
jgi:hypothetical protein